MGPFLVSFQVIIRKFPAEEQKGLTHNSDRILPHGEVTWGSWTNHIWSQKKNVVNAGDVLPFSPFHTAQSTAQSPLPRGWSPTMKMNHLTSVNIIRINPSRCAKMPIHPTPTITYKHDLGSQAEWKRKKEEFKWKPAFPALFSDLRRFGVPTARSYPHDFCHDLTPVIGSTLSRLDPK